MAVPDDIRAGIATAKAELLSAMTSVDRLPVIGRDVSGPTYGPWVIGLKALVEDVGELVVDGEGTQRLATSKLTFLEPIAIDLFDIFRINGVEANVAKKAGLLDPDGVPYFAEVWLGQGRFR